MIEGEPHRNAQDHEVLAEGGGGSEEPAVETKAQRGAVRRIWSALSRPWRWAVIVTPGIAVVVGLVGSSLDVWDRLTEEAPTVRVENLSASMQGTVRLSYSSMLGGDEGSQTVPATQAVVSMNNPTSTAVAFYELTARVLEAVSLKDCQVAGGDIGVSGTYELDLPKPLPGEESSTDIAWEVERRSNDSLSVTLGQPTATTLTDVPIYKLALSLRSGSGEWLEAGSMIAANELPHYSAFLDPTAEAFPGCARQNLEKLSDLWTESVVASDELSLFFGVVRDMSQDDSTRYFGDVCPLDLDYRVLDLYPVDVVDQDGSMEVVVAVQCLLRGDDFGSSVAIWDPASEKVLGRYVPVSAMFAQDLSGVGGKIWLDYLQTRGGGTRAVRDTMVYQEGSLVVENRSMRY